MYKKIARKNIFRFRRFCRAKYAVFRSVHLEVCIGHVASYIADSQLKKSRITRAFFCTLALLLQPMSALADDEPEDSLATQQLSEVAVIAVQNQVASNALHVVLTISAESLKSYPTTTFAELLDYLPGVDVRTRGANGVQADVSMRGGTCDQVLILLNGVNITDVQTGHANLDVPIDLKSIDRIEILQGTSVCQFGLSAFSGAINIITNQKSQRCVKTAISVGAYGLFYSSISFRYYADNWRFMVASDYNKSAGYISNTDYKYGNVFFSAVCADSLTGEWQLQLGGQLKDFGSNSFYSLKYPNQFEATKTLLSSLTWHKNIDFVNLESSIYYRGHTDKFELFRDGMTDVPAWYTGHNYHATDVCGANAKVAFVYAIGKTAVGIEFRNEHIFSNVLGDNLVKPKVRYMTDSIVFTKAKNRLNINYFIEQTFYVNDFVMSLGASGNYNSMFANNFACSANFGYKFNGGGVFANVSRALRLPTFTELYYQSATQTANPNLKPEKSMTAEIGACWAKYGLRTNLNAYYRVGLDLVDWVKTPDEEKWHCVNHTRIDAVGVEALLAYKHGYWLKNMELTYAFCQLNKNAGTMLSKYALDYLKHKLSLNISHGIYKGFGALWQFTYQQRVGNYVDYYGNVLTYRPIFLLDGRVFWQNYGVNIYVEASNIVGQCYYDYGGVEQPGRWLKAGMSFDLNLETRKPTQNSQKHRLYRDKRHQSLH